MKNILLLLTAAVVFTSCEQPFATSTDTEENSAQEQTPDAFPLSNLDTSVSPCEDFYQYAIGGWLNENPVPSTESRWSSFNVVLEANNKKIKTILHEFSSGEFEQGTMEQKIGDFYKSAMDSARAEELGIEPLMDEFKRINGLKKNEDIIW